ncbi:hypothetical protein EYF80_058792 [Liparis tanakae]|uniref:Uncharacterized protein n=1 Tax=Liparis tanakae TaxID=230148 RepID=A0A4Z2EQ62_9TELE|nr:hypothetical protein EYF80_058792 [Liparis tanakae]
MQAVLTLCQDALDTISEDDGCPLNIQAVEEVGCMRGGHPLATRTLHKIHHLQGMVRTHQPARTHNLGVVVGGGEREKGCVIRPSIVFN